MMTTVAAAAAAAGAALGPSVSGAGPGPRTVDQMVRGQTGQRGFDNMSLLVPPRILIHNSIRSTGRHR